MKWLSYIRKKRDLNLCAECPPDTKGGCCYTSMILQEKDHVYCERCPDGVRPHCTERVTDPNHPRGKKFNVILENHPCKYLDGETLLCKEFKNRFEVNRVCHEIGPAIKKNLVPRGCLYVRKNKKYQERLPKIRYAEVKDLLCPLELLNYKLKNGSPHEGTYGIKRY